MQATREIFSFSKKNTQVYLIKNNSIKSTDVDELQLQDDEASKYVALKSEKRKKEFIAVRILVQEKFPDKKINYKPSGAPYFSDHSFSLSITHTNAYVAIGVSTEKRIGIDIEEIQEKIIRLGSKFMHPSEVIQVGQANLQKNYTCYWCAKEALYKWTDISGLSFQNDLPIFHQNDQWIGKSLKISNEIINLEIIEIDSHILCFTY